MKVYNNIKQGSDEWLELRAGVITGTKLKGVMAGPKAQETAIFELIGEEFAPLEETYRSPAMERGNELEPIAKAKYENLTKQKVTEVGFIKSDTITDSQEYLGLSPDGLIGEKKAIEIKCPGAKNHTKYIIEDKIPEEYKSQIIHYFIVIEELEELDFITFNPDYYIESKRIHIINVKREDLEKDIEKAKEKIKDFRKRWLDYINKIIK